MAFLFQHMRLQEPAVTRWKTSIDFALCNVTELSFLKVGGGKRESLEGCQVFLPHWGTKYFGKTAKYLMGFETFGTHFRLK